MALAVALALALAFRLSFALALDDIALAIAAAAVGPGVRRRRALLNDPRGWRDGLRRLRDLLSLDLPWRELLGGLRALLFLHLARGELLRGLRGLLVLELPRRKRLCGLRPCTLLRARRYGRLRHRALLRAGRDGRRHHILSVILLDHGLARLVTVLPALKDLLLLDRRRIAAARILALVHGQRRRCRNVAAVPTIPPTSLRCPRRSKVHVPTRRRVHGPGAEGRRRLAVVANRDSQHVKRHGLGRDFAPRSVVPGARVPATVEEDPVEAVVEEDVGIDARRVIDRVARHADEFRIDREVYPDADVRFPDEEGHLRPRIGRRAQQHRKHECSIAHFRLQQE